MNTTEQNSSAATTAAKAKQVVLNPEKRTVYLANHFMDFAKLEDLVKIRKALEYWFLCFVSLEVNDDSPADNDLSIEMNIFYYQRLTAFVDRMMQPAVELEQSGFDYNAAGPVSPQENNSAIKEALSNNERLTALLEQQQGFTGQFQRLAEQLSNTIGQQEQHIEMLTQQLASLSPQQIGGLDSPEVSEQ